MSEHTLFTEHPLSKPAGTKGGNEFWFSVYQSIEGKPKVNFEMLAHLCGYKNAQSASVMYFNKRKAASELMRTTTSPVANGTVPDSTPTSTPKATQKRGRKPKQESPEPDGSPKKKRGRGRPPKKGLLEEKEEEEGLKDVKLKLKYEPSEAGSDFAVDSYFH